MPQNRHRSKTCLALVLLSTGLCSTGFGALAQRIQKIADPRKVAEYSVHVVEPASGATIYSYNANKPLIPASNMKLVTTAAALKYLGADFAYTTRVGLSGDTLVVLGSGDPILGDKITDGKYDRANGWVFDQIVQALQDRGVTEINDIVVDTTIFDDERVHPSWPARDYNKWYACEVCGLNYNINCIELTTTNLGGAVAVQVEPATTFVEILNQVEPITAGESAVGSHRTPQPNRITVFGKWQDQGRTLQSRHREARRLLRLPAGRATGPSGHRRQGQADRTGVLRRGRIHPGHGVHHAAGRCPEPVQYGQSRPGRRRPCSRPLHARTARRIERTAAGPAAASWSPAT